MTNEYNGVPITRMTTEEYGELAADSPELEARRASRAQADSKPATITVPLGIWRTILPAVAANLATGIAQMRRSELELSLVEAQFGDDLTDDQRAEIAKARALLERDKELAQQQRYFIGEWQRQLSANSEDAFFAVDSEMVLEHLDAAMGFGEYVVSDGEVLEQLSPANVAAELELLAQKQRSAEVKAQEEVAFELARFAKDVDSSGKTLN